MFLAKTAPAGSMFLAIHNVWQSVELNMHREPTSWVIAAMPAVLSQIGYGHPHDYTELTSVRRAFDAGAKTSGWLDTAMAEALALDPGAMDRAWTILGPDDKGLVDFVWLSFSIFGLSIDGFIRTYFLLSGISVVLFVVRFWREPWSLLVVGAFLAAHLAYLPVIPINNQLRNLIAPRVLSILSMLALLHLALEVILTWTKGFRWYSIVLGLGQVGLLLFTLHMTSRAGSQVLGISVLIPLILGSMLAPGRRLLTRWGVLTNTAPRRLASLVALWPVIGLWIGLFGLDMYKAQTYNPMYFQGETSAASHVFWHSLFVGLSAHPDLAQEFDIRVSDVAVIAATGRYLDAAGRHDEWVAMGGESLRFTGIRRGLYDPAVRDMLVDTCWRQAGRCLAAVLWYKPLYASEYLLWFLRWKSEIPAPHMLSVGLAEQFATMTERMDADGKVFGLWRVDLVLAMGVLGALLAGPIVRNRQPLLLLLLVGVIAAVLPSLIAYPIAHTVSDLVVMFGLTVYVLIGIGTATLVKHYTVRAGRGSPYP